MAYMLKQKAKSQSGASKYHSHRKAELPYDPEAREANGRLQRSYGNQAAGKIWASFGAAAGKGLKPPYAAAAQMIAEQAKQEQRTQLWRGFEALSAGQKQAVLLELAGSPKQVELIDASSIDWARLQAAINKLKAVRLEDDEPEREGDADQSGAQSARYELAVTGLLPPYLDIASWLNYKANKQGKAALMQKFGTLSLAQKKIALHKMADQRKLRFKAFTEEMTVIVQYKEWVDWDKMRTAMNDAEKIKLDPNDETAVQRYLNQSEEDGEYADEYEDEADPQLDAGREDELEEEEGGWISAFAPSLGEEDSGLKEAKPSDKLGDPDFLAWLLFGVKGDAQAAAKQKAKQQADSPETIVDRFLQIEPGLPLKAQHAIRKRRLLEQGYRSSRQFYVYLLTLIVALLFERGVMKREKPFADVIGRLGLFANNMPPTKQRIADKLRASQ